MFTSRQNRQPNAGSQAVDAALRSVVNQGHLVNDAQWALSIVNKIGTEHAFLVLEGLYEGEHILFRSDMFLDGDAEHSSLAGSSEGGLLGILSSASSGQQGFVRVKQIELDEWNAMADKCQSQTWGINQEQTKTLLERLIKDNNKAIPYNLPGNHPIWSVSQSNSQYQNCVSWCRVVIKEALDIDIGNRWNPIQRPSQLVNKAMQLGRV